MRKVKFVDLGKQYERFREEILHAFDSISRSGHYVFGPHLSEFESKFSDYIGSKYALGVANGSDALYLSLKALGIGPGDEVITAPNSFIASAWTIANTGASVVFADVRSDFNIDPEAVEKAITSKTKAIMPVHLTGKVADMVRLQEIATRHQIHIVEDSAQAVGASLNGQKAGSFGIAAGFSLHPLKNLHVHGDGGVLTTSDQGLYDELKHWRNHGLRNRDECAFWGINSRLDAIQAAIANIKLPHLDAINSEFRSIANRYSAALSNVVRTPLEGPNEYQVYHRYMIQTDRRNELQANLAKHGIDSKVNYPIPIHLQDAAKDLNHKEGDFPVAERLANEILSLPIYAEMTDEDVDYVIHHVLQFFNQ
jgi:dTDP-4-amino-4,6-dideoxygalactose transaminase